MAHEVENMFSVNETPWHKLGKVLDKAPSIQEGIKLAGLNWEVGLKNLVTGDGQAVEHQATYRKDTNAILGVVGPNYKPLQNIEAFNFFNPFLEKGQAALETAGSLSDGKRVWVMAKLNRDDSVIVPKSDDRVAKYIMLSNSHDGTMSIRCGFSPVRIVCSNTLRMAINDNRSKLIRIRHTEGAKFALDEIAKIMDTVNQSFETTAEAYRFLASKDINKKDLEKYVKIVFSQTDTFQQQGEEEVRESRMLGKIIPLFEKGLGNDMPGVKGTYWAAYNAVTDYLTHRQGKSAENRFANTMFGGGTSDKAIKIALEMAKKV